MIQDMTHGQIKAVYDGIATRLSTNSELTHFELDFIYFVMQNFDPKKIKVHDKFIHKGSGKIIKAFQNGTCKLTSTTQKI